MSEATPFFFFLIFFVIERLLGIFRYTNISVLSVKEKSLKILSDVGGGRFFIIFID